ncbi:hypothetical protein ID866_12103 [Astraeus odoratus]|nr:hypothetical protein ID866_12103 [Astraeus odoratus]
MSTCKSSMIAGTPAKKSINWTKVPDEELATDIDNMDSVGDAKAREKHRRLCVAHDKEIWRAEKLLLLKPGSGSRQIQRPKRAEAGRHQEEVGGERKKRVKKAANEDDDDEVVILSGWKTKRQGGSESLKEVTDCQWGELIQAVSTCMDMANSHLERIASAAQSNGQKMQQHFLLMEGLVGQQQVLVSKLVEMAGAAGSGGAKGVTKGQEEPKEPQETQGEGSEGQEETEGVPGGVPGDEPENALGNEPENGAGAEDGAEEEAQKDKGKGKEKAL